MPISVIVASDSRPTMARHINGEESVLIALNLWGRGDGTSTASIKLAYLYLPNRWRDLDACAKTDMAMSSLVSACRKAPGGRSGSKSKFQDGESELNEDDNPSMTRKLGVMDNTLSRLHTRNTSSALPNVRNRFPIISRLFSSPQLGSPQAQTSHRS